MHYEGMVWCVSVPTRCFVARRNGQVFVTGNTGMPKGFLKSKRWPGWGTGLKPVAEHWVIARKPFKGSTAGNLDKHGTGAFHVDAARVGINAGWSYPHDKGGSPPHQGGFKNIPCKATKGRYPPHIALTHSPECVEVGTRKVKTGKAHRSKGGGVNFGSETRAKPKMDDMTYADADGNETTALWACVPGCPVRVVDEQSGTCRSAYTSKTRDPAKGIKHPTATSEHYSDGYAGGIPVGTQYADSGGASRYWPNFTAETEVDHDGFGDYDVCTCEEHAHAGQSSTPGRPRSRKVTGSTALDDASGSRCGSAVKKTPGATSASETGAGTGSGESLGPARSTSSSKADGCGNKRTGRSRKATRSTTRTKTERTTTCRTSNSSRKRGTTTTTSADARRTESSKDTRSGSVSDAAGGSGSICSTCGKPERTRGIAGRAAGSTGESGTPDERAADDRFWPTFAYIPKASSAEKNRGCEDMPPRDWREGTKSSTPRSGQLLEHVGRKGKPRPNNHSTVKSVDLMRLFVRLTTIEGGVVLDPFNGSGTTGVATVLEGARYIGIEGGDENSLYYCEVSRRRIGVACPQERRRPTVMDGFV